MRKRTPTIRSVAIALCIALYWTGITVAQRDESKNTRRLFDGRSLSGWKVTNFGGEGECRIEDGLLIVDAGYPMSGVTCTRKDLPKSNYELTVEAMKIEGDDFFCAATFPVNDSHCTFVAGGWGGVVTGLSCIDDKDASDNKTRSVRNYKTNRWYKFRVRVLPERILVWIDEEKIIDVDIKGRKISLRNESSPARPLGLSNFQTSSKFKNISIRRLIKGGKN